MKKSYTYLLLSTTLLLGGCVEPTPQNDSQTDLANPFTPIPLPAGSSEKDLLSQPFLPPKGAPIPIVTNTAHTTINEADKTLIAGSNRFAYKLYSQIAQEYQGKNLIISPLSWDYAMGMVAAGASPSAREELVQTMGWSATDKVGLSEYHHRLTKDLKTTGPKQSIFVTNALWVDKGSNKFLVKDYPPSLLKYFDAGMALLNLSSAEGIRYINEWIERKSYSKIKELISPDMANEHPRFILTNALYLKAPWRMPFDEAGTCAEKFFAANGEVQEVQMMHIIEAFDLAELPEARILRIPTEGYGFYLNIILPRNEKAKLTADFLAKHDPIQAFGQNWTPNSSVVRLSLPKLKIKGESIPLIDSNRPKQAQRLGLASLIKSGSLSGIMSDPDLFVGKVLQKCIVGWDESGVEAAASTAVEAALPCPLPDPVPFKVDRPFFFAISHVSSGKLLFIGQVNQV